MVNIDSQKELFVYYNQLNKDSNHMNNNDDICTPMECVKLMIDYLPSELWTRSNLKILDPCCGNGNFGAYCKFKTSIDNIWFNDLNDKRLNNCIKILNPKNIMNIDALTMKTYNEWDMIMANPPYSGGGNKNQSISNNFIEHCIKLLKNEGYLCFVTPNNWMTFNNNNKTLKALLEYGSFLVIDNDIRKYFPGIGSSFSVFIWQKGVFNNKTLVVNNYLKKDKKRNVVIPNDIPFIPLYLSNNIISIIKKVVGTEPNGLFKYRCDLHNFTQDSKLRDKKTKKFKYETIHTVKQIRYSCVKQDIFDKWNIIVPLSTYFIPFIKTNVNVTQSVGYIECESKEEANIMMELITRKEFKCIVHLTRFGNFNNIMVLKHIKFMDDIKLNKKEKLIIDELLSKMKY